MDRNLSDSWTGFTKFTSLNEKPPDRDMSSGERLTTIQATTRPDHMWPEMWSDMSKSSSNERESSNGPSTNRSSIMRGSREASTLSVRMMES